MVFLVHFPKCAAQCRQNLKWGSLKGHTATISMSRYISPWYHTMKQCHDWWQRLAQFKMFYLSVAVVLHRTLPGPILSGIHLRLSCVMENCANPANPLYVIDWALQCIRLLPAHCLWPYRSIVHLQMQHSIWQYDWCFKCGRFCLLVVVRSSWGRNKLRSSI